MKIIKSHVYQKCINGYSLRFEMRLKKITLTAKL